MRFTLIESCNKLRKLYFIIDYSLLNRLGYLGCRKYRTFLLQFTARRFRDSIKQKVARGFGYLHFNYTQHRLK